MARVFRGESTHKVDAKGRVSIPALFRRVIEANDPDWTEGLAPEIIIVHGDHRRKYLECYTVAAMQEVDDKIAAIPRGTRRRRMLEQMFQAKSFHTSVDETGRLVLPARLRQQIGLEGEAVFTAAGDTFQIWKPETYEAERLAETAAWLDALPEDVDPLVLLDDPDAV